MTFKTYTAATVAEAVGLVKKDLGTRAVILHTRTVSKRYFLGLWKRDFFEITAGPEGSAVVPDRTSGRRSGNPAVQAAANQQRASAAAGTSAHVGNSGRAATGENVVRENRSARLVNDTYTPTSVRQSIKPASSLPSSSVRSDEKERTPGKEFLASPAASAVALAGMTQELSELKSLVTGLVVSQRSAVATGTSMPKVPEELFEFYLKLVESQVAEKLAGEIVSAVQMGLRPDQLKNRALVRARVLEQLEKWLPCESAGCLSRSSENGPSVLMLVGPTGVGKTTTLAKLAAQMQLKQGKRVALITLDTYRIAAVDQLRRYAEILGCELRVVNTPEELQSAIASMSDVDQILIDSAGRSPRDVMKINELRRFVEAAKPTEVHLVLSATSSNGCIDLAVEKFSQVRVDRILLTKLDEAAHLGVILNVVRKVNKKLSFLTTGQNVPDDIEASQPRRLAEALLGDQSPAAGGLERRSALQTGALAAVAGGGAK